MSDLQDDMDRLFDDLAAKIAAEVDLGGDEPEGLDLCDDCLMPLDLCVCDAEVVRCACGKKEFHACDCGVAG